MDDLPAGRHAEIGKSLRLSQLRRGRGRQRRRLLPVDGLGVPLAQLVARRRSGQSHLRVLFSQAALAAMERFEKLIK